MKRPAFQFYPADWRRDSALQSCSVAARGLWIELMCVMHDCEPYGVLSVNGKAMSVAQLARLVGEQEKVVARLLSELEDAGVCSRDEQGRLFSRRMVKDEAVRESRANGGHAGAEHGHKGGEYGKKGGRPRKQKEGSLDDRKTPLKTPLDGFEEPPPSSSSSSSSTNTPSIPHGEGFEQFWAAYPKKVGKDDARKAFAKRKPDHELLDQMLAAIAVQRASLAWTKDGGQFIPNPSTWLNQGRWQDETDPVPQSGEHSSLGMFV